MSNYNDQRHISDVWEKKTPTDNLGYRVDWAENQRWFNFWEGEDHFSYKPAANGVEPEFSIGVGGLNLVFTPSSYIGLMHEGEPRYLEIQDICNGFSENLSVTIKSLLEGFHQELIDSIDVPLYLPTNSYDEVEEQALEFIKTKSRELILNIKRLNEHRVFLFNHLTHGSLSPNERVDLACEILGSNHLVEYRRRSGRNAYILHTSEFNLEKPDGDHPENLIFMIDRRSGQLKYYLEKHSTRVHLKLFVDKSGTSHLITYGEVFTRVSPDGLDELLNPIIQEMSQFEMRAFDEQQEALKWIEQNDRVEEYVKLGIIQKYKDRTVGFGGSRYYFSTYAEHLLEYTQSDDLRARGISGLFDLIYEHAGRNIRSTEVTNLLPDLDTIVDLVNGLKWRNSTLTSSSVDKATIEFRESISKMEKALAK